MDTDETPVLSGPMTLAEEQTEEIKTEDEEIKESCHDSGIDIRDTSIPPPPPIVPIPNKKVSLLRFI